MDELYEYYSTLNNSDKVLYTYYHKYLMKYLEDKLNITEDDEILKNSESKMTKIEKKDMDIYQYLSSDMYDYFYLRNNMYIDRLTEDERNTLNKFIADKEEKITPEIVKFIESTFKKVIIEMPNEEEGINVSYGIFHPDFFAPNLSIVYGVRYDDYDYGILDFSEELRNHRLQDVEILGDLIKIKSEEILDIPVRVIKYDKWCVKKMGDISHER